MLRSHRTTRRSAASLVLRALPRSLRPLLAVAVALMSHARSVADEERPRDAERATYRALPAEKDAGAPFERAVVTRWPDGERPGRVAWELELRGSGPRGVLCAVRAVTSRDPLAGSLEPVDFHVYRLRIPSTGECFEYRDAARGGARLPAWRDFTAHFIPSPTRDGVRRDGVPETCGLLGHVLSLERVERTAVPGPWQDARVLELDPELLIGTGRTFRDAEGKRLPQQPERRNYTYVPWTREEYETMIAAGFNSFALVPGIEAWLRGQPVFYRRGAAGDAPLAWPADFYRSNFEGSIMFEDEPACIMLRDTTLQTSIRHFGDVAEVLRRRVRAAWSRKTRALEKALRDSGVALGDMELAQIDWPVWETRFETAWYQLEAAFAGFVHEGRYDLSRFYGSEFDFDAWVRASTGLERRHSGEDLLRYHFALLRGAARAHGKDWGTSIYGQADPELSRRAVTLAYDMGARWVWFWTSDHDHHLPWPEQLELARLLRKHARAQPRASIRARDTVVERAIALPAGSFLFVESPTGRRNPWDLWWVRELDPAGENAASRRYTELRRRAFIAIHRALDDRVDFDVIVDHGGALRGYREVIRIALPTVDD